jgi:ribonuclease P protein component
MKKTIMLKKNYEFKNVLTRGKYYSGKDIEAFIFNNHKNLNCLGLAISVKTSNAVIRNKIKRLIRENYTSLEENLKTGYSIVFLWKKKSIAENANFYDIKNDIIHIFEKSDILKKEELL